MVTITATREGNLFPTFTVTVKSETSHVTAHGLRSRKAGDIIADTIRTLICSGTPWRIEDPHGIIRLTR